MILDQRVALLLTQLALALLLVNELVQLSDGNAKLNMVLQRQQASAATVKRIDAQLDALARGTQALAQGGDADAARIVEQLAQNGIRINDRAPH